MSVPEGSRERPALYMLEAGLACALAGGLVGPFPWADVGEPPDAYSALDVPEGLALSRPEGLAHGEDGLLDLEAAFLMAPLRTQPAD